MKNNKLIIVATLMLFISCKIMGQSGISMYHLKNSTFQGNHFNPAYIPDGKVFLGMPGISGVNVDFNSRLNVRNTAIDTVYDYVNHAKNKNLLNAETELSTFYIGFRKGSQTAFSFFIRERMSTSFYYSKNLLSFLDNGDNYQGPPVDLSKQMLDARYYREYGVGFWKEIKKLDLQVGVRVKYLNGMFNISHDKNLGGKLNLDNNGEYMVDVNNGVINASGYDLMRGYMGGNTPQKDLISHLISNGNFGLGIDIGAHKKINDQLSVSFSLNDVGFINWKTDSKNLTVQAADISYQGVESLDNIAGITDELKAIYEDKINDTVTYHSYKTGLNTSSYSSVLFDLDNKNSFTGTIAAQTVQSKVRMLYGIGYTRKVGKHMKVTGNLIRTPQQGIDFGFSTAVDFGSCQLYMASDKILTSLNLPKTSAVDFRFGINFIFGRTKVIEDGMEDLAHASIYSRWERTQETVNGTYWIVKKKKANQLYGGSSPKNRKPVKYKIKYKNKKN